MATVEFAACRGAGRRTDTRVSARTMATARAAKPATSAISEPAGVPPRESADTLATGLAPSASGEPGETVGNRLPALPPELSVGVGAATPSGATVDSGDKFAPIGLAGAKTTTEAAAAGSVARLAALPTTVRLTAVTFVAVSGTVTSAWNCR